MTWPRADLSRGRRLPKWRQSDADGRALADAAANVVRMAARVI
jgi:hypothetical protein